MTEPFGWGLYKRLMRRKGTTLSLSKQMYGRDPLKSFETALGFKPGPVIKAIRKRKK